MLSETLKHCKIVCFQLNVTTRSNPIANDEILQLRFENNTESKTWHFVHIKSS